MLNFLINLAAFILAISFLVAFHEWGHYCVARWMGVKVLRFSIGFGPVLYSKYGRNGVEYCLSAIPLGGYVKMLDEREGPVNESDLPYAFNRQSVWKRIAIVLAGPLNNFLLAMILFVVVLMMGIDGLAPIVVDILPDSPASHHEIHRNDEITAVDGVKTTTLMQVSRELVKHLNEASVALTFSHAQHSTTENLPMPGLNSDEEKNILETMGLKMGLPALVGTLQPDSPAQKAGLKPGDHILSVNETQMPDWMDVVKFVSDHPLEPLVLGIEREHSEITLHITPEKTAEGRGYMGVYLAQSLLRKEQYSFFPAVSHAVKQTGEYSWLTLKMIYFMISGQASLEHLSGPVSIAQVAGATAKIGVTHYLDFLAIISISLGVLNLLPIPVLDGGHLLFYVIEVIRRKPISEDAQMIGLRFGFIILVSLMLVALYNDMLRLV